MTHDIKHSVLGSEVYEDGHRVAMHISAANAKAHAAALAKEHHDGRVAQSHCQHGPCDWDRIHDLASYAADPKPRPVVLCQAHAQQLAEARAR